MGPYEHLETSATVKVNTEELAVDTDEAIALANDLLDQSLQPDVVRATETTRNDDSYVEDWKDIP